jgi:hypothetical protein
MQVHYHACLVMLSYGFLALEQRREKKKEVPVQPGKKRQPTAQDHRLGDPPRFAATAPAEPSAGL